jgi:hypothetical protein
MELVTLNKDGDFIVKESATYNILIGAVFLLLSILAVINFINEANPAAKIKFFFGILSITLPPAILFVVKGLMGKTVITINKSGIYCFGVLKTNWSNFIEACVTQDEIPGSIEDNFVLMLHFYKDGEEGPFEAKIPLRNTLDKSEEQIIAAIKYFSVPIKATE